MRRLEKLNWSRNAHLHNVMLGLPNPHRFWQTGKADVSAEWWLRNSGDNRRATFLFSASFQQLLLLHCGLAGACGCGAGASSQEQSQCSAVNISYQSPAPSLPWILLTGRCRGWNQIQHVHYWIIFGFTAAQAREDERGQACFTFAWTGAVPSTCALSKYPCFSGMKFCGLSQKPINKLKLFRIYWTTLR